jgi:anti-sigma-K factor RskA
VTHQDARNSLEAWAIGALPATEARDVEAHLSQCADCRVEAAALSEAAAGVAATAPSASPSPLVRERLMQTIGATAAPAVGDRRASSWVSRAGWLAAAAALILSALLTWDGLRLRDRIAELSTQLATTRALLSASESRMASLERAADRRASAMAVVNSPDVARIDLAGQPDAPDASARAFWSRSKGMVFSASKLPPPPAGKTYQVWVLTSDPAPLSAGLIEPDATGSVEVVFSTPSDIPQPVAVAVTLEPAGGVPSPTGAKYLVGVV